VKNRAEEKRMKYKPGREYERIGESRHKNEVSGPKIKVKGRLK